MDRPIPNTQRHPSEALANRVQILERLLDISRHLNSTLEMRPLLQRVVDSARELTNADGASILLMEGDGVLRFATATGPESAGLEGTEVPQNNSLAGWVVKTRQIAIVDDAQADARIYNISSIDPTQSIIAAPMIFGDQVIGVLESVTTKARHRFKQEDQETIQTLAGLAAVAVQNARLFQQSDWVAEIVHEIRSPLTAILSYAELLLRPNFDADTRRKFILTIQQETERVSTLATRFLDLARLESGRTSLAWEPLHIEEIIQHAVEVVRPNAEQQQRTVAAEIPQGLPEVIGDRTRLHQVLLNLLTNAVKYSDAGDEVTVTAALAPGYLIVSVRDTGPGIPQHQLPHLFQKFRRLPESEQKTEGTGLGLVVTREIVEAHRGRIWVESESGKGSSFSFSLPVDVSDKG